MAKHREKGSRVGLRQRSVCALIVPGLLFLVAASSIGPSGCEQVGVGYLGTEVCLSCHDGRVATNQALFRANAHYLVGCEACHGPGLQHVRNGGPTGLYIDMPINTFTGINSLCIRCHAQEVGDYMTGAHADARAITCLDCHDVHDPGETRLNFTNNRLCLQCHAKHGFESAEAVAQHTFHTVDPSGTGTSRCTTCHMPPARRVNQKLGRHGHSLIPLPPITSNEAAQAGVTPVPPNSCSGIIGCHDGSSLSVPAFDVDVPEDNDFLQAIFEFRYPNAGAL